MRAAPARLPRASALGLGSVPAKSCRSSREKLLPAHPVFLDRQVLHHRILSALVVHEVNGRDVILDDCYFLQRRDDQELKVKLFEQLQAVARAFIRSAAECLVYHYETKTSLTGTCVVQPELVGQRRCEDCVSKLFFLTAGFAGGVAIEFALGAVRAPALFCAEFKPIAYIGHLGCPAVIKIGLPFASGEPLDQRFDLKELLLGIKLAVFIATADAGAKIGLKIPHVRIK